MTDRFEELAIKLFMNPTVDDVAAALRAQHKAGQKAMREKAARECYFPIHHQHPLKPAGVVMSTSPASPGHADIIRALPIEDTTP